MSAANNRLKIDRVFPFPAPKVFQAVADGKILINCGSDVSTWQNDFRVGGRFRGEFANYDIVHSGVYREIVENRKIAHTWEINGEEDGIVTITLVEDGPRTRLTLEHTGISGAEERGSYQGGWTSGLDDLSAEMEKGKIRMVRVFKTPVAKLYAAASDLRGFFGYPQDAGEADFRVGGKFRLPCQGGEVSGVFAEIEPEKKIVMSWSKGSLAPGGETRLTLLFDSEDDGRSSLELLHEPLLAPGALDAHRAGWNEMMKRLLKRFA